MTPMLIAILLGVIAMALSTVGIWAYRKASAKYQDEVIMQRRLAEVSETRISSMQNRDASLQQLQQKQRTETIDASKPQHLAERNDFDNDWSDRLPDAPASASHSGAADAPSASGTAGD